MLTVTQFNKLKTDLQNWLNHIDTSTPIEPRYLTMRIKLEAAFRYLCDHTGMTMTIADKVQNAFSKMAYNSTIRKTTISQAERQTLKDILQSILKTVYERHTLPSTSAFDATPCTCEPSSPTHDFSSHPSLEACIGPGDTPFEALHRMFMTVTAPKPNKRSIRQLSGEDPAETSTAKRAQPTIKGGLGQGKQAPALARARKALSARKEPHTLQVIPTEPLEEMFRRSRP